MKRLTALAAILGVVLAGVLLAAYWMNQEDLSAPVVCAESGEQQSARPAVELLADVPTDTAPVGPPVGELLTIEDVSEILGRNDIFFLTCGG